MKKKYHEAVEEYSEGIKQKSSDVNMNAVLYCNRATAQFYLGNYTVFNELTSNKLWNSTYDYSC